MYSDPVPRSYFETVVKSNREKILVTEGTVGELAEFTCM
jgi:hypothetical protein